MVLCDAGTERLDAPWKGAPCVAGTGGKGKGVGTEGAEDVWTVCRLTAGH